MAKCTDGVGTIKFLESASGMCDELKLNLVVREAGRVWRQGHPDSVSAGRAHVTRPASLGLGVVLAGDVHF